MPQIPVDALRLALGQEHLDRRAVLRRAGWDAVPHPRRLVLIDADGNVALRPEDRPSDDPPAGAAAPSSDGRHRSPRPAPRLALIELDDPLSESDLFLGVDASATAIIGRMVTDATSPGDVSWASLRSIGLRLEDEQRAIVTELLALSAWHQSHPRCPRCGSATAVGGLGWWRTCAVDGTDHYPRTDPAVIMLLRDDEDNALLGRQTRWPEGAFSTLAGFVEPGESAEAAVGREVHEEVGLTVSSTSYLGSQPWPFPASLMLGFHARVPGVRPAPQADGDEIAEARWIAREDLAGLAEARDVRLPGRLSIAYHLIARWYGEPIPDDWCRW